MKKPPSLSTGKNTTSIGRVGRSTRAAATTNSRASLSPSSNSSSRAGASRPDSPVSLRIATSHTNDGNDDEPWMETATPGKFDVFQPKIFPILDSLTAKPEYATHAFTKRWMALKRIPNNPMSATIKWRNIKVLLGINTMHQYRDFIAQCPGIATAVVMRSSSTTKSGFDYGILAPYQINDDSPPVFPAPGIDDESYVFDSRSLVSDSTTITQEIQDSTLNTDPSTPKQTNVCPTRVSFGHTDDYDSSITTGGTLEVKENIQDSAGDITEENTIQHKELASPATADVLADINKLNDLHRQMQQLAFKFESCMKDYNQRLDVSDARITKYELNLAEQLNRATVRFESSATRHYDSLTEFASTTLRTFQGDITDLTEKHLTTQREKLIDTIQVNFSKAQQQLSSRLNDAIANAVASTIRTAEEQFKSRLDQAIETAIQELLSTADDATDHMNQQADYLLREMVLPSLSAGDESWKTAPPKPSKLFPNVDVSKIGPTQAVHSNEQLDTKNSDPIDADIEWGKDGPVTTSISDAVPIPHQVQFHSLPPVCHTDMLKRVHLPYPGRDQSYLWYLQLKSNGNQYGIYLISTESFKKDKSLCPTEIYGIKIDATRYNEMKCTLYHFLAQRSIITMEYTDLRNIINRNAMTTDGYRVLYDIMARIHPALNTDNTFTAPRVGDYSNIHEYYTYFDSYLLHEQYSGRKYTPREQLNRFLCGLDASYAPAITRIRHQLDNWNAKDNSVPENLQLANLPVVVEQYMEDQGDDAGAIIRRISKGSTRSKPDRNNNDDKNPTGDATVRPYVDVKCPLCQSFGHHKYNCDRMALWLHLKEGSKLVDDKLRVKLHTNYADMDAKRRT